MDVPWSENRRIESTEEIKVLKLPPRFHIPAPDGQQSEEDYNPLNMKTLTRNAMERRRQATPNPKPQQKAKHD